MNKRQFINICKKPQHELKMWLEKKLRKYGYTVTNKDGYLLAKGNRILLTAHLDTVHEHIVKSVVVEKHQGKTIISSPQGIGGDDRCGVFMILSLLEKGYRPTVLFCEDEEIGGIGSKKFIDTKEMLVLLDMLYLIELDRVNANDSVFYDCGNAEFEKYINQFGFKTNIGSFSDISHLSPVCDKASVNLSCGYYKAHTTSEYVVFEEMEATINKVARMLDDEGNIEESFDYKEIKYDYGWGKWNNWYDNWYDNIFIIEYVTPEGANDCEIEATTKMEAIGIFMSEHQTMTYENIIGVMTLAEYEDMYCYELEKEREVKEK